MRRSLACPSEYQRVDPGLRSRSRQAAFPAYSPPFRSRLFEAVLVQLESDAFPFLVTLVILTSEEGGWEALEKVALAQL